MSKMNYDSFKLVTKQVNSEHDCLLDDVDWSKMDGATTVQDALMRSFSVFKENTAIECGQKNINYKMLQNHSLQIKKLIMSKGVSKKEPIGIYIEDRVNFIIAMLGILQAGCIFVPLSSQYPANRTKNMINLANIQHTLTDQVDNLNNTTDMNRDINYHIIDDDFFNMYSSSNTEQINIEYAENDPVYLYFTSGTTSKPKTILGKNKSLLHCIKWEIEEFNIKDKCRVSQFTIPTFDAFLRDIFVPLLSGGTICIPSADVRGSLDPKIFFDFVENQRISIIHCTPDLFNVIISYNFSDDNFSNLKYVFLYGEQVIPNRLKKWFEVFSNRVDIINFYGATEVTMDKVFHRITKENCTLENAPVGQPDDIPVNLNGKVDRKALVETEVDEITREIIEPRRDIETRLVDIHKEMLNIDSVSVSDDFFEIGGDSLKAVQVISIINKTLKKEVGLGQFFNNPTVASLSEYINGLTEEDYIQILVAEEKEYYSLSPAQMRMYTVQQIQRDSISYNMPEVMYLNGKLDITKLKDAFNKLINRHETLRTSFIHVNGEVKQYIHKNVEIDFKVQELNEDDINEHIEKFIRPFDLATPQLLRVKLIQITQERHVLMTDTHHIVSDGVSNAILIKELMELYKGKQLAPLKIQYKDYSEWFNRLLKTEEVKKQKEYWLNQFSDEIPVLNMPTDYARPVVQSFIGDILQVNIDGLLTQEVKKLAIETGTTVNMVLLAAYKVLLSKYSGQEDIVVGSITAGRSREELQQIIGMFVNTLVLRSYPNGEKTFTEYLGEIKNTTLSAYENQNYQFEDLVDELEIKRDLSRNPLFDTMFVMQNIDSAKFDLQGVTVESYGYKGKVSKFDLTLQARERAEQIVFSFTYNTDLFRKETIKRLAKHYINILNEIVKRQDLQLNEIDCLSDDEKVQILEEFNDTAAIYPDNKSLMHLFEEQVARTPEKVAIIFKGERLTYKDLNQKVNILANVLRKKGVASNNIVGIIAERSIEMVIGIYAILKAGGAYLPIDPKYPNDRINYMLHDSKSKVVLAQGKLVGSLDIASEVIDIDQLDYESGDRNLTVISKPTDLAYVIYTSGSTGKPKGVMIEHTSVINRLIWLKKKSAHGADTVLQKTTYTFDPSVCEILWVICGGTLCLLEQDGESNPEKIVQEVSKNNVKIIYLVPATLKIFIEYVESYNKIDELKSLSRVIVGGDVLPPSLVKRFYTLFNETGVTLNNVYGPTECTVDDSCFACKSDDRLDTIPIGKPLDNVQLYILDKNQLPQPIGVPGELYIGGVAVGRGYLNRPELTAEKFLQNPFRPGERMYRTGDLARWLPDGNVDFMGRIDTQIKIRGRRIELGEIESVISEYEGIKEAVVIAKGEAKMLVAYLVCSKELDVNEIRGYLHKHLPEYMVPVSYAFIESIPLTRNGKVDRKKLAEIEVVEIEREIVGPRNETEAKLLEICRDILNTKNISITDSFFSVGGNSLKAMELMIKIHRELNVEMELSKIFSEVHLDEIAEAIEMSVKREYKPIPLAEEKKYYNLSPAQKRMYTVQQIKRDSISYNMPEVMYLNGKLDTTKLKNAFYELINRHESLRTSFEQINGEVKQYIHKNVEMNFKVQELNEDDINEHIEKFIRPFDLATPQLLRVKLIQITQERHVLMTDTHHIVSDGVSNAILIKELMELYQGKQLAPLKIQYKDYSEWFNRLLKTEEVKKQKEYWLNQFSDEIPVLNMPTDYTRPGVKSFFGDQLQVNIDGLLTQEVKKLAIETGTTINMVLLAAYKVLLSKYSGQEDIVVGSITAGRPREELEHIVGMFANTLAIRSYPKGKMAFEEFIYQIKDKSLAGYENQNYQFEDLVDELEIKRDLSRNPLFDVLFVMQNNESVKLDLEGISVTPYGYQGNASKFDLTLQATEKAGQIEFSFAYDTDLFKKETIKRLCDHYINILKVIVRNRGIQLNEIDYLSDKEKAQVIEGFNDTDAIYPDNKSLMHLFEEQVARTPEKVAIIFKGERLTYKDLNQKVNILANVLRKKGVAPNNIVGIIAERSIEMVIGIYAILKAGGAYLPIDPKYPNDRINYMTHDSKSKVVLAQGKLVKNLDIASEVIAIDELDYEIGDRNLTIISKPTDLAYVMYTSGSTGKPKGVRIEHTSIVNYLNWLQKAFALGGADTVLQKTIYTFDQSVCEILWGIYGGTLCLLEQDGESNPEKIVQEVSKNNVTIICLVPATLKIFMEYVESYNKIDELKSLSRVIVGGDVLPSSLVKRFYTLFNETGVTLNNVYGPTECTVHGSYFACKSDDRLDTIPIGKPLDNVQLYILDKNQLPQPIGVPGELYIGGVAVGRGYLNRPELTAEKFLQNPFRPGERMYRTGDLARWLPDGNVDFMGRIDTQIKIRGRRIELGEIESVISEYEGIKEAVVIAKGEAKMLVAYLVCSKELDVNEIRGYLHKHLPEYMVPVSYAFIESIPLTRNGKVDRKKLAEIEVVEIEREIVGPRNETEAKLLEICRDILNTKNISITDSFFSVGGNSLKAMELMIKIHRELNVEMELSKIFSEVHLDEIAEAIEMSVKREYKPIPLAEEKKYYNLSPAQKRMYTVQQIKRDSISYNMPEVMYLNGKLDTTKLKNAFYELINRHESLRTSFEQINGEVKQYIHKNVEMNFKVQELNEDDINEHIEKFIRPFDLATPQLLRVKLIQITQERHVLMTDTHHIVSDGVSNAILIKELMELYQGKQLAPLKIQYKDYSEWFNRLLKTEEVKKQKEYWLNQFSDEIPVLNMPTDYTRPGVKSFFGDQLQVNIDSLLTQEVKKLARETGTTINMVLLAAYKVLLSKYSGQEDIVVGSITAGRPREELEHIVGMFVNTLALRSYPNGEKTFAEYLGEIKNTTLSAYENQNYQFEDLVHELRVKRDLSRNPLFDTMFVMQNGDSAKLDLKGVTVKSYGYNGNVSKFDLTLSAIKRGQYLSFNFEYFTDLFTKSTIERLGKYFVNILHEVTKDQRIRIKDIRFLDREEKEAMLYKFNDSVSSYSDYKTIIHLFEEQVKLTPQKIAISHRNIDLTYTELLQKVNSLAYSLKVRGVEKGSVVGVLINHSIEAVIGVLAILKLGGIYLPLDKNHPQERLAHIICNAGVRSIITNIDLNNDIYNNCMVINLDNELLYGEGEIHKVFTNNHDVAYIIYTSGSTGLPKGTVIEHKGLSNYVQWASKQYLTNENEVFPWYSPLNFDLTITSIFTPLVSGNQIRVYSSENPVQRLYDIIADNKATVIKLTPSHLEIIREAITAETKIRCYVVGGEQLKASLCKLVTDKLSKEVKIYNEYGPTEAVVGCMICEYNENSPAGENVPIGVPADNMQIYLLDKYLNPVMTGAVGEIYISGVGVAKGYLGRTYLNRRAFIKNPYLQGQKMYKTGDLAKRLANGYLEYLGRKDNQVKVRGYRVELSEIESVITRYKGVNEAVVLANGPDKRLTAYITSISDVDSELLKSHLKAYLPGYMIPISYIFLDRIPIASNGKIDRKTLGKIEVTEKVRKIIKPRNKIEASLTEIWKKVLEIDQISIRDSFFDLGGNSIKAITVLTQIKSIFNIIIPLEAVANDFTVESLSGNLHNLLAKDSVYKITDNIILIKKGKDEEKKLFLIHTTIGEVSIFANLAKHIDNVSLYGIKINNDIINMPNHLIFENLCNNYVEKIRKIQPQGPYSIAGWCIGGAIAFQIALTLESENEQVEYLGLLNAPLNSSINDELINDDVEFIRIITEGIIKNNQSKILNWDLFNEIACESSNEQKILMLEKVDQVHPGYTHLTKDMDLESKIKYLKIYVKLVHSHRRYTPNGVLESTVHYIESRKLRNSLSSVWKNHANHIELDLVDVEHYSMLGKDVKVSAAVIDGKIRQLMNTV